MPYCIFCNTQLGPDTTREHVLHDCLGGRLTTQKVLCSHHNNVFGGTIDDAFAKPLHPIRNLMLFPSGSAGTVSMMRGLQAGEDLINLSNTGQPQLGNPPVVFKDLGDGNFQVAISVQEPAALKKLLPNIAARLKIPVEELSKKIADEGATLVERRPGVVNLGLGFGDHDALRSMVKSCLVLLALNVGNDTVREAHFSEARDFVLQGGERFNKNRVKMDTRDLPGTSELRSKLSPFFNLIYIRSNGDGRVIGHFTIYNTLGWKFVLCESVGPKNCKFAIANNPADPTNWSDEPFELPDVPFEWLDAMDIPVRFERVKERLAEMEVAHRQRATAAEIGRIVDDALTRHRIVNGDDLSKEVIGEFADRTA